MINEGQTWDRRMGGKELEDYQIQHYAQHFPKRCTRLQTWLSFAFSIYELLHQNMWSHQPCWMLSRGMPQKLLVSNTVALTFGAFPKVCKVWVLSFPSVTDRELAPREQWKSIRAELQLSQCGNGLFELPVNEEERADRQHLVWHAEVNAILGHFWGQKGVTVGQPTAFSWIPY